MVVKLVALLAVRMDGKMVKKLGNRMVKSLQDTSCLCLNKHHKCYCIAQSIEILFHLDIRVMCI